MVNVAWLVRSVAMHPLIRSSALFSSLKLFSKNFLCSLLCVIRCFQTKLLQITACKLHERKRKVLQTFLHLTQLGKVWLD